MMEFHLKIILIQFNFFLFNYISTIFFFNFTTIGWAKFNKHYDVVQYLEMQKDDEGNNIFHEDKK